jgi:hypothetical protein
MVNPSGFKSKRVVPKPAPAPQQQNPSLLSTIAQGAAFGTGSSLAREFISRTMNMPTNTQPQLPPSFCSDLEHQLSECILHHNNTCDNIIDLLQKHCYKE